MADQDSSDDLDDLRKKRLAYFQAPNSSESHVVAVDSSAQNVQPNLQEQIATSNMANMHKSYKDVYAKEKLGDAETLEKKQDTEDKIAFSRNFSTHISYKDAYGHKQLGVTETSDKNQHIDNKIRLSSISSTQNPFKDNYCDTKVGIVETYKTSQNISETTASPSNTEYRKLYSQENAQSGEIGLSNRTSPIESIKDSNTLRKANAQTKHNSKLEGSHVNCIRPTSPSVVSDILVENTKHSVDHSYSNSAEKVTSQQNMEGYNETVERLIRATKEELLGKKASDDIWKQFVKDSGNAVPKETNEIHDANRQVESYVTFEHSNKYEDKKDIQSEFFENNETRSQGNFENKSGMRPFQNADSENISTFAMRKPPFNDPVLQMKSLPAKSMGIPEPSTSKLASRWTETNHQGHDSDKVEAIFSSRQTPWSKPSNSFVEMKDSQDFDNAVEKKVDESLNLSDLGLSTHRPEADSNRESVQASDLNLGDTITIELRTVLGEEKFQQFLCKAKREIDDLHENRSDRSVRKDKTPRLIKESSSNVKHERPTVNDKNTAGVENKSKKLQRQVSEPSGHSKSIEPTHSKPRRQISSADARKRHNDPTTSSKDFKPKLSDGDAVTDIIVKHMFDDKEKDASELSEGTPKSTAKESASEQERKEVDIPELNLSEINKNDSPRPKLNRPKHEPFIIYPDKSKANSYSQQESPKSDIRKNYEQVPVAKTVVFSADEIYSQAYGSLYQSHHAATSRQGHQHDTRQYSTQTSGSSIMAGHTFSVPLTPTTPVYSGSHGHQPFTPVTPTPRQTQSYHVQNAKQMDELARFQQYMSNSVPMQAQPVMQVPHPPTQPYQIQQIQGHQGSRYDHPYTQTLSHTPNIVANQFTSGSPQNVHAIHQPHPPFVTDNYNHTTQNLVSASLPQGLVSSGYQLMYTSPPVMVPHPPAVDPNNKGQTDGYFKPGTESPPTPKTSNVEVQNENTKQRENDKVTIVEESTFTSVSQIPDNDVMVPHPPTSKKNSKPSPRKPIKGQGQDPKRHIDGIRQHHEQRRHEQEEAKLTDEEILARQRKFAKASLDRYFASLENLYVASRPGKPGHLEDTIESHEEDEGEEEGIEREKTELLEESHEHTIGELTRENEYTNKVFTAQTEVVKAPFEYEITDTAVSGTAHLKESLTQPSELLTEHSKYTTEVLKANTEVLKSPYEYTITDTALLDKEKIAERHDNEVVSKTVETNNAFDDQTVVNSEVTSITVNAGGVTERLEELGVHVSHSGENNVHGDKNNNTSGHKKQVKRGKKLLVCPECQGLNKEYMSWCTHCGEMIIGVEPKLVSKTRDGKLRIKPMDDKDDIVTKLNTLNSNAQSVEVNYIQEIPDKPFSLNLEELKTDDREAHVDPKNVSPIKSDGKDSGRPSSEDRDNDLHGATVEDELDNDTKDNLIVQNTNKSHIDKRDEKRLCDFQFKESKEIRTSHLEQHHTRNNKESLSSLSQDDHIKQLSDKNSNNALLNKDIPVVHSDTLKNAQDISETGNSSNKHNESEMLSVADRVKRIESERESQLKSNSVTNTAQTKNTPMFTGDLAMDSIGASYLVMSKKHELLQTHLHLHDDKHKNKRESDRKGQLHSKESHTSVFKLNADESEIPHKQTESGVTTSLVKTAESVRDRALKGHNLIPERTENKCNDLQSSHIDSYKVDKVNKNTISRNDSNKVLNEDHSEKHLGYIYTETASEPKVFHDPFPNGIDHKQMRDSCGNELHSDKLTNKPDIPVEKLLPTNEHLIENRIYENKNQTSIDTHTKVSTNVDKGEYEMPPPLPEFSSQAPINHSELALKLPANSMDFSMDYSHVGSLSYEALDEFKTEEEMKAIKEEKKKERRRKRGHGAIDVEVFGIEEMRESRNSSRGQRLVPVLNLAGNSSDEDDFSVQSDTKSDFKPDGFVEPAIQNYNVTASNNAWEPDCIPELPHFEIAKSPDLEVSKSPDTSARPLEEPSTSAIHDHPRYETVSGSNEDWQLLFDLQHPDETGQPEQEDHDNTKDVDLDQPFLEQVLKHGQKPVKSKARPTSAKSKSVKSKVQQSWDGPGYQRKWAKSSTAWSSYNAGELNTSSSLRSSVDSQRPASAPKTRNPTSTGSKEGLSRDASPLRQMGRSKRPVSADFNRRSTNKPSLNQPASPKDDVINDVNMNTEDLSLRLNPDNEDLENAPVNEVPNRPPYRLWLEKDKKSNSAGQRPTSASKHKGKQPKHKKKSGNHGNDLDLSVDLVTIEHRLPKPGILEWLSAVNEEPDNSDMVSATSPKSTYDKYLEMTPRIEAGTISKWQCLPDEILLHVFAYVDQTSLTKCAQVCHQFYRVAMDESLWKYITIKKRHNIDDDCLIEISKRHPVSLALIQCQGEQVTAKGLRDLFRECSPTLKELNISRCSKGALQGDSLLLHAAARCNHVTHIDASWCHVTDSGLMAISNTVDRLESLCINGCHAISDDGLETIIKKHGSHLRVLEMFGCFNITPRGLRCISNNCINLISINLGNCYKLTDSCIAQLSASLGRAESADLRGCKQIKDNCIRRVVKNCPRLKNLSLANCPNITDVSLLEISTYLTDIRSIDLCGCRKVTDNSIRALVNTCTNLRDIDISSTGCTHRSVSMIANFCGQRLETLKINFLSDVTEQSLVKLAKHCRRLKSVHMYGCPSVRNLSKIQEEHPTFTINM